VSCFNATKQNNSAQSYQREHNTTLSNFIYSFCCRQKCTNVRIKYYIVIAAARGRTTNTHACSGALNNNPTFCIIFELRGSAM
jgi:hypothetical protein